MKCFVGRCPAGSSNKITEHMTDAAADVMRQPAYVPVAVPVQHQLFHAPPERMLPLSVTITDSAVSAMLSTKQGFPFLALMPVAGNIYVSTENKHAAMRVRLSDPDAVPF